MWGGGYFRNPKKKNGFLIGSDNLSWPLLALLVQSDGAAELGMRINCRRFMTNDLMGLPLRGHN